LLVSKPFFVGVWGLKINLSLSPVRSYKNLLCLSSILSYDDKKIRIEAVEDCFLHLSTDAAVCYLI
jgi:hypothetical protein